MQSEVSAKLHEETPITVKGTPVVSENLPNLSKTPVAEIKQTVQTQTVAPNVPNTDGDVKTAPAVQVLQSSETVVATVAQVVESKQGFETLRVLQSSSGEKSVETKQTAVIQPITQTLVSETPKKSDILVTTQLSKNFEMLSDLAETQPLKGNTGVYKTVAAQIGEAIVAQLEAKTSDTTKIGDTVLQAQTPQVITAAQVEQAVQTAAPTSVQPQQLQQAEQAATTQTLGSSYEAAEISEFKVTLKPEHLGEVVVRLITDGAKMSVLITAATESVRDLLLARAGSVRVMVEVSGVTIDRYEVQVANNDAHMKANYLDNQDREQERQNPEQNEAETTPETTDDGLSFAEVVELMNGMGV
jgi:flagellar hook-length control protein FliK